MEQNADRHGDSPPHEPADSAAASPAPPAVDRLEMISASMWTRGMTIAAVLLASAGLWFHDFIGAVLQAPQVPWRIYAMVFGPPVLFAIYVAWRWWETPRQPREVLFGDEQVILPVSAHSGRTVELAYEEIKGVFAMARGGSHSLLIDTGSQSLTYTDADFVRDDALAVLRDELVRRVHRLPNAEAIVGGMRRRQKLARIATSKPATVTKGLLGILAAYFAVELFMGVATDPFGLLELGANAPALIEQGQYFRLISANFLHQGWIHIILNGIALLFLGGAVEKLVGPWRMLLIYLIGAIAGSVGSYLAGPGMISVGSSTAIFGLFGAFLVLHLRYWRQLPPPFRQSIKWWVIIIGLNAGLPAVVPIIDYMAHLTGFLGGGLITWLLLAPMKELKPDRKASRAVQIVTAVVSAIFVAGLVQAAIYAVESHPSDDRAVFAGMLEQALDKESAPEEVNQIGWITATNPEAGEAQLSEAHRAVEKVVEEQDDRVEIRDTLATLSYRLAQKSTGDRRAALIDEAIAVELEVLKEAEPGLDLLGGGQATYASQLARFLNYRREIDGALVRQDLFEEPVELAFDPSEGDGALHVEAPADPPEAATIYAVARVEGQIEGLVRTCLSAGQRRRLITDHSALERWPNNVRILAGLIEPAADCDQTLEFWPMSQEIRDLP